jgi:hypothetical protein
MPFFIIGINTSDSASIMQKLNFIRLHQNDTSLTKEVKAVIKESLNYKDLFLIASAYLTAGNYFYAKSDQLAQYYYKKGCNLYNDSIIYNEKIALQFSLLFANYGNFVINSSNNIDYDGISSLLKSKMIIEKYNISKYKGLINLYLSAAYYSFGNFEKALVYGKISVNQKYFETIEPSAKIGIQSIISIGFSNNNQIDSAKKYLDNVSNILIKNFDSENNGVYVIAKCFYWIGKQNYKESLRLIDSLSYYGKLDRSDSAMISYLNAKCLYKLGKIKESNIKFIKALELCRQKKDVELRLKILEEIRNNFPGQNIVFSNSEFINEYLSLKNIKYNINMKDQIQEIIDSIKIKSMDDKIKLLTQQNKIKDLEIKYQTITKNNSYMVISGFFIALLLALIYLYIYLKNKEKIHRSNELIFKQELKINRLQNQINPHFTFNALSNIQSLIYSGDYNQASNHLLSFTKLLRTSLINTGQEFISLTDEIDFLANYIYFEQRRFKSKINFTVDISQSIDPDEILIFPLLLQPFVENSLKHGGFHKLLDPQIKIKISEVNRNIIEISIIDNGITLKEENKSGHISKGINISSDRIRLFMKKYELLDDYVFVSETQLPNGYINKFNIPKVYKY